MSSLFSDRLRRGGVVILSALLISMGVRPAFADPPAPAAPRSSAPADTSQPSADDINKPAEPAPAPRLQLLDEGPPPQDAPEGARLVARPRHKDIDDGEERPFWKSWIFWTVTGVLVAGAVGLVVYRSSGTSSSIAPCPPSVVVSLGCFGAGRGQ